MPTMLFRPAGIISNPVGPSIWDADETLILRLNAAMAQQADGAAVSSIIAVGSGSIGQRTFETKNSATWNYPTLEKSSTPGGGPALVFSGNEQISNLGATYDLIGQPITYFVALQIAEYVAHTSGTARIFSAAQSSYCQMRPSTDGRVYMTSGVSGSSVGGTPTAATGMDPLEWGVIGVVFNGAESLFLDSDGAVSPLSFGPSGAAGVLIGGAVSATPGGTGFKGKIAELRQYNRAMNAAELRAKQALIKSVCGI